MNAEFLRRLPLFAELPQADLDWLAEQARPMEVAAGSLLMEEGDRGDSMYVVLDGEFEIIKRSDRSDIVIAVREPGEFIGEMSLLDHAPRSATVRALRDSRVLMVHADAFHQLVSSSPSAALTILHTVSARLRQNEALLRQSEKMAALGTLAAGLAHELNNPAAAVRRSAAQLREATDRLQQTSNKLPGLALTPTQTQIVNALLAELAAHPPAPADADPLAHIDRERALETRLDERGVPEAWDLAPALASLGWDSERLAAVGDDFSPEQLAAVLQWLGAGGSVQTLLGELHTGAERISEIVKSVKAYSYLDQAPIQEIDVREGIENTLVILRHKLKQGVTISRHYAPDLPRIEAYGSELNQVWTNILDNAIDAMGGAGEIRVGTHVASGNVVVEIADTGPGIPPDIQPRIFEPFFTTKPPGVGTGLGLHIAYNIVHKHYGQIRVTSKPGNTCFQVTLPLQLKRG